MNLYKMGIRLVALAIASAGIVAFTGTGPALACGSSKSGDSHKFASTLPQVRYGQSGTEVLGLQLELRDHGYKLNGTGYYGPNTLAAVKHFQRKNGIRASGIVGPKTWQKLVGSQPAINTHAPELPDYGVRPGQRGPKAEALALTLRRVVANPSALDKLDWHTYTPALQRIVKDFQRKNGIRASGIVGPKTWTALYKVSSIRGQWETC